MRMNINAPKNQFKQFNIPIRLFDAYNKEIPIQKALGSNREFAIWEVAEIRSSNYVQGVSGWRLTVFGLELQNSSGNISQFFNDVGYINSIFGLNISDLVNDSGYITLADIPTLDAGAYSPVSSDEVNLDAPATLAVAQYTVIGNKVSVFGRFNADPTAPGAASFEIDLPFGSALAAPEDVAGVAFSGGIAGQGAEITAAIADGKAKIQWIAVDVTAQDWSYQFSYQIL